MKIKLLIIFMFFAFFYGNSQQFSLKNLQSKEHIEVALDSAYQWIENGRIKKFIENYITIEKAIDITKNSEFTARFNAYKAGFYFYLHDDVNFESFMNEALSYYEAHPNNRMLIYLYNLKGIFAANVNLDRNEAIKWSQKALDLVPFGNQELEKMSVDVYFNLAVSNTVIENWDKSFEASSKCIELALKHSQNRLPLMYYHRGLAQLNKGDAKGALSSFNLAKNIVTEKDIASHYKNALYLYGLSEAYKALGDIEKSSHYSSEYNKKINNGFREFSRSIGERISKHSELLVNLAKMKEEKAQEELKESEVFYTSLIVGLALLIIAGLLIFIFQLKKHQNVNTNKNSLLTLKNNELKTIKEDIENALKVKTDFLNSITHELRTPLYAINSITHLIKENEERKIDDSQMDILSFSGDHLLRFINDVIDFNLGANNFEFQKLNIESINLDSLLEKLKKTITFSLVMDNENNFVFNFDPAISQNLKIDSLKLSRIIINLLNNASKYTHEGEITFIVKELENTTKTSTIEFCIKDTGRGITKTQLNEIKIAFKNNLDLVKRIDNKASGLGMGLVMVNRLLKLYNSELNIESQEGLGTTMSFQITFDIDTSSNDLSEYTLTESTNVKRHILIVDDNRINQLVTSKIIKKLGYTSQVVKGGKEAINLLKKKNNYDFILMDIMMPEMDGFQATKIIKSINPEQKIIALTAMSIRENKQKFIDFGFVNVIEKPFIIDKFKTLIT